MKLCASNQVQCWQTVFVSEIANFLQLQNVTSNKCNGRPMTDFNKKIFFLSYLTFALLTTLTGFVTLYYFLDANFPDVIYHISVVIYCAFVFPLSFMPSNYLGSDWTFLIVCIIDWFLYSIMTERLIYFIKKSRQTRYKTDV